MKRDSSRGRSRFGSIADLVGGPAKSFEKPCARCGQAVESRAKKYCRPCSADRYDETVAANKAKYREAAIRAKGQTST